MIYTDLTKKAMRIAYDAHLGQTDRGGTPYICHPLHLAAQVGDDETLITTALLHDVIEDTGLSSQDLLTAGIPMGIVHSVELLTRTTADSYAAYINRLIESGDPAALRVKIEDLKHNLDTSRTVTGTLPEYLLKRYNSALKRVEEAYSELMQNGGPGKEAFHGQQSERQTEQESK